MKLNEFINKIKEINDNSWGYGNEILYLMGKDINALNDPQKLAGAIWIIGRSYAASPQRRSYGNSNKNINDYAKISKGKKTRPIWPVKTQNDGREGFFDKIAKDLNISCLNYLLKNYNNSLSYSFSYPTKKNEVKKESKIKDLLGKDRELLIKSIAAVLSFNSALSKSIEAFDDVPSSRKYDGNDIKCNNHISFASKFLHFYFPNLIFIVDGFACNGGKALFSVRKNDKKYIITPADDDHYFEAEIYDNFKNDTVKAIVDDITQEIAKEPGVSITRSKSKSNIDQKNESNENGGDEEIEGTDYISHCVRSYLLGAFLKSYHIDPKPCIETDKTFQPMPRLTDAVFLNIKKELTPKEKANQKALQELYYDKV